MKTGLLKNQFFLLIMVVCAVSFIVSCSGADGNEPYLQNTTPAAAIVTPGSGDYLAYWSPFTGQAAIYFTGSYSGGDEPVSFRWDFDGVDEDSEELNPGFIIFNTTGVWDMTFTVTDATGDIASDEVRITVVSLGTPVGKTDTDSGSKIADSIVAGDSTSFSFNGDSDIWAVKISNTGTIDWHMGLGGTGNEVFHSCTAAPDGGYLIAGTSDSFSAGGGTDLWLVKISADGSVVWQTAYDCGGSETLNSIRTVGNGYIAEGFLSHGKAGIDDLWTFRIGLEGDVEAAPLQTVTVTDTASLSEVYDVR